MHNKTKLTIRLLILMGFMSELCHAAIYQSMNSKGNPQYTDVPTNDSSLMHILRSNSYSSSAKDTSIQTSSKEKSYTHLTITSPANLQTLANQNNQTVRIAIEPSLKKDDSIALYLDEVLYQQASSTEFLINNLERGQHTIQAKILNSDGKILLSSEPTIFFVHLPSKLQTK